MRQHVHDEIGPGQDHLARWSASRMLKHLREVHDLTPPMSWDIGRLHQAHLEDHQKGIGFAVPPTDPFGESDECGAYFGLGGGKAGTCQRPKHHPEITQDGIGHSEQPIPIQPKPEETPMPETATDDQLEERAKALYEQDADGPQPDWDDLGQETRDHYRDKARRADQPIQTCGAVSNGLVCQLSAGHGPVPAQDPADGKTFDHLDNRAGLHFFNTQRTEGEAQILADKLICAMTGISFNSVWVQDESLSLRGAMRSTYSRPVRRLLAWLEQGGALELPTVAKLATDLGEVTEQRDTLRQMTIDLGGQLEAVTGERDRALAAFDQMNTQRVETETELRSLYERQAELLRTKADQLAETRDERDQALEAVMAAQTKAAELREQLEDMTEKRRRAVEEATEANGVALQRRTERDEARQTANRYAAVAGELQDRLAQQSEIRHIPLPGQGTDVADTIGRARAAVELRKAGKHFMGGPVLLFTKDAVRNILGVLADQLEKTDQPGQPA